MSNPFKMDKEKALLAAISHCNLKGYNISVLKGLSIDRIYEPKRKEEVVLFTDRHIDSKGLGLLNEKIPPIILKINSDYSVDETNVTRVYLNK